LCKVFEEALDAITFFNWNKEFGPAQNILEPVEGQGIRPSLQNKFEQKIKQNFNL
jgi:hypothetical protein